MRVCFLIFALSICSVSFAGDKEDADLNRTQMQSARLQCTNTIEDMESAKSDSETEKMTGDTMENDFQQLWPMSYITLRNNIWYNMEAQGDAKVTEANPCLSSSVQGSNLAEEMVTDAEMLYANEDYAAAATKFDEARIKYNQSKATAAIGESIFDEATTEYTEWIEDIQSWVELYQEDPPE